MLGVSFSFYCDAHTAIQDPPSPALSASPTNREGSRAASRRESGAALTPSIDAARAAQIGQLQALLNRMTSNQSDSQENVSSSDAASQLPRLERTFSGPYAKIDHAFAQALDEHKSRILNETKNVSSFVVIGQTLHKLYYEDKLMKTQKEFLEWTKAQLGFSKSTTYEYIISYRIYSDIASKLPKEYRPPMYQSHCQLLSKVPQPKLVDVWVDVCNQAPNGVITTAFLEQYLDKHNLRGNNKSRMSSIERENSVAPSISGDYGGSSSQEVGRLQRQASMYSNYSDASSPAIPPMRLRKSNSTLSTESFTLSKPGKHYRQDSGERDNVLLRHGPDTSHFSSQPPPPPAPISTAVPVNIPPPNPDQSIEEGDEDNKRPRLPLNDGFIFELSKNVVLGQQFDMVMQTVRDFRAAEQQPWFGRLWCNLSGLRAFSTSHIYGNPAEHVPAFDIGVEKLLQLIFTKFAKHEFVEGLFLLKGEFGADWFTPILQHPYCILRHNNPPMQIKQEPEWEESDTAETDDDVDSRKAAKRRKLEKSRVPGGDGAAPSQPYESYVMFYLGPNIKDFYTVFRSVGLVPGVNSW
ncbi:hypothetical protein BC832DRAFT_156969 [Gaertneriomyces semiglobifer]|nr:hypothetical protein BC832DRAFT_156969 [Gaertneriomyces semiglobifer]